MLTLDEINTEAYRKLVSEISHIEPHKMDDELAILPAVYGYYAGLLAEAKENMEILSFEADKRLAKVRLDVHVSLRKQGAKITEKILDTESFIDEIYLNKKEDLIKAGTKFNLVRNILTTLEYKKDMLIQLSVNTRQEKKMFS